MAFRTLLKTIYLKKVLITLLLLFSYEFSAQETFYLGQHAQGGIIYHLYQDDAGKQHGLVLSLKNISREAIWGDKTKDLESCESTWDGRANTNAIMFATRDTTIAAGLCDGWINGGYDDWYLPAIFELQEVNNNLLLVDRALNQIDGADPIEMVLYWSSTESNAASAWFFSFYDAKPTNYYDKTSKTIVRAIRSF